MGFLFFIDMMSSCFVHFSVSLQADYALCAAPSYQHALGPDCVEQHAEHPHHPLLYQHWTMLQFSHNLCGKR